jgi:tetratricopeptide (TPR) repeat protein
MMTMTATDNAAAQKLDFSTVKAFEQQLDDVMEFIDTTALKLKLTEVEVDCAQNPSEMNRVRLGIIYHETSLNLSFFSKTEFKGYAQKSFELLNGLFNSTGTPRELLPFIASYRASALSLVGAETGKLRLLGNAFEMFRDAVEKYSDVSYAPEFMRGSVAENLPRIFFSKRKLAKRDFQSIIEKYEKNNDYANRKVMSFTYWAWAKQRRGKKFRVQAIAFLDKAIRLDPNYEAGRKRAEELKAKLMK